MAEESPLLYDSQLGGRRKKSAVDTTILLTDFIERNKANIRMLDWLNTRIYLLRETTVREVRRHVCAV
jgi:hypothetical protein